MSEVATAPVQASIAPTAVTSRPRSVADRIEQAIQQHAQRQRQQRRQRFIAMRRAVEADQLDVAMGIANELGIDEQRQRATLTTIARAHEARQVLAGGQELLSARRQAREHYIEIERALKSEVDKLNDGIRSLREPLQRVRRQLADTRANRASAAGDEKHWRDRATAAAVKGSADASHLTAYQERADGYASRLAEIDARIADLERQLPDADLVEREAGKLKAQADALHVQIADALGKRNAAATAAAHVVDAEGELRTLIAENTWLNDADGVPAWV